MSVVRAGVESGRERGDARPWGDAMWLAGREIRRVWMSYPGSALYLLLFSTFFAISGAFELGTYSSELGMVALTILLATPFFAREYMSWARDPIAERLSWWRSLPIGVPTIVRARALAILAALPLNAAAFFAPVWIAGRWGLATGDAAWYAVAIVGVSLAGAGATLALELSVGIRRWIVINTVTIVVVLVAILALGLSTGVMLFEELARAARWNGPLTGIGCVVAGAGVFLACMRLAEDHLRRRDLTS